MPGRLAILFLWPTAAFESVEAVVMAMKHYLPPGQKAKVRAPYARHPFVLPGQVASVPSTTCGLTGEEPAEEKVDPQESSFFDHSSRALCAGWSRDVCCSKELLAALEPVVMAEASHACTGCAKNLEAAVCTLVCSPEAVQPSAKAFSAQLTTAYCEAAQDACDKVNPCERAVDLVSQFFGPITLDLVASSPLATVPPYESCETSNEGQGLLGRGSTIPSHHRSSLYVMSIWREATSSVIITSVIVLGLYCVAMFLSFFRKQDLSGKIETLKLIGADELRPRLEVARL
jgi:hypothetical protein